MSTASSSRYLVRFDDLCPTMRWSIWDPVEALLDQYGVRPIVAVIPDNKDPKMELESARPEFWDRVRAMQAKGYTIALHGYQHRYVNQNAGLMRLTPQSEFTGLPREEQREKLEQGLAIFRREGVRADAWVAPSHSFDQHTLELLAELGVPVVSDGMWPHPFKDDLGLVWVPCQIFDFKRRGAGTWTVCLHPNTWKTERVERFGRHLAHYQSRIIDIPTAVADGQGKRQTLSNRLQGEFNFTWDRKLRPALATVARTLGLR